MYSCCRVPTVFKPVEDQHKPKYETKDARRLVSGTQQAELDLSGDTPHQSFGREHTVGITNFGPVCMVKGAQ